jgi:hypothetical protein
MTIDEKCDFILIALYEKEISGEIGMVEAMSTLSNHNIKTEFNEHITIMNQLKDSGYAVTQVQGSAEFRAQITEKGMIFYKTSSFNLPGTSIESQRN